MRIIYIVCFLFATVCTSCSNKADQTPVKLRLNYKNGDTDTYIMKTETDGGAMKVSYETEVKLTVDSVHNKGEKYDLSLDVVSLKMETDMGDEKESYHSTKSFQEMSSSEKELDAEFRPFLVDTTLFAVTNKGEAGAMRLKNGQNVSVINQPIDFSNLQIIFPEKPVGFGEEWTTEKTNPLLDNKTTSTYSISKIEENEVYITVKSKVGGIKNVLKENTLTGEYQIDRSTGRLKEAVMQMPLQSIAGGGKIIYTISSK